MKSRKLWLTVCFIIMLFCGPIIYKELEIDNGVATLALGAIAGLASAYLGANVLQKKILSKGEE